MAWAITAAHRCNPRFPVEFYQGSSKTCGFTTCADATEIGLDMSATGDDGHAAATSAATPRHTTDGSYVPRLNEGERCDGDRS